MGFNGHSHLSASLRLSRFSCNRGGSPYDIWVVNQIWELLLVRKGVVCMQWCMTGNFLKLTWDLVAKLYSSMYLLLLYHYLTGSTWLLRQCVVYLLIFLYFTTSIEYYILCTIFFITQMPIYFIICIVMLCVFGLNKYWKFKHRYTNILKNHKALLTIKCSARPVAGELFKYLWLDTP